MCSNSFDTGESFTEVVMSSLFCPRCAMPQPVNESISEQEIAGPGDETIKLVIRTYHCAICYSFIRSESVHERDNDVAA